jgi:maleylacetate reductase
MNPFVYQASPVRVVFGRGTLAQIGEEVLKSGKQKALVLTTKEQGADGQRVVEQINATKAKATLFAGAVMHTPVSVTEEAMKVVEQNGIDCLIALGGGSSIGLSKAIAYRTNLTQIAIPTTYAGSEATPILGQTIDNEKKTLKHASVLPGVILYDVDLTRTLPKGLIITSGINAIAHAIEAL